MTRGEMEYVLKRMVQINRAIRRKETTAKFYVGNRKETIEITDEVYIIREVLKDIKDRQNGLIRYIIESKIEKGDTDEKLIIRLPMSKNAYYHIKKQIEERVYQGCIKKGIVEYIDLLKEEIN